MVNTIKWGYRELVDMIGDYGRGYNKELLNQAIFVNDDGMTAIVTKEAFVKWRFDNGFQDAPTTLLETEHWALESGIPKIVKIKREHSHLNPFIIQRLNEEMIASG